MSGAKMDIIGRTEALQECVSFLSKYKNISSGDQRNSGGPPAELDAQIAQGLQAVIQLQELYAAEKLNTFESTKRVSVLKQEHESVLLQLENRRCVKLSCFNAGELNLRVPNAT
jgi:hypothetical protein